MDQFRLGILGDDKVGKTTLAIVVSKINRAVQMDQPSNDGLHQKQLVVDNRMCYVEVSNATDHIMLHRDCDGFLLVYSVTSHASFKRIEAFHQSLTRIKSRQPPLLLIGTKCDKAFAREVAKEEGWRSRASLDANSWKPPAKLLKMFIGRSQVWCAQFGNRVLPPIPRHMERRRDVLY
ncbi:P-loop containing nucleoside triphosphate hydrolase protein, partial [Mycena epipterygia]